MRGTRTRTGIHPNRFVLDKETAIPSKSYTRADAEVEKVTSGEAGEDWLWRTGHSGACSPPALADGVPTLSCAPFAAPTRSSALLARKHGSRLLRQIPEHGTAQGQVPAPEHKDQGAQAKPASV